jgi:membrane-associated phospholipid phosphatase
VARLLRLTQAPWPLQALNLVWVLAIAWSTVAIRQHVVLDAVAGASLGAAFALLSLHLSPRLGSRPQALPRP